MPPTAPLLIPLRPARLFARRILNLDTPLPGVAAALRYHGYVQIDPINVCGRMHDLILRNRVMAYGEGDLMRHLHGGVTPLPAEQRIAFEHHLPGPGTLVAFPLEAWPYLPAAMRRWSMAPGAWAGRLTPRERELAKHLLAEIAARGPLGSEDFDDTRRATRVWGAAKLAKATLQKLFFHGRLLIAQRVNNRRRYDLPERVLPAATLTQREPSATDTARWLVLLKLRQRRLVALKKEELKLAADAVQPVVIRDADAPILYCLREDVPLLESCALPETVGADDARAPVRLLAPLDPLIYDRRVAAALWNFDYTWEVYTPLPKRVRGYYALPVLAGTEIIGHVDPKADRTGRKLVVVSRRIRRGHALAPALREFGQWLGLE